MLIDSGAASRSTGGIGQLKALQKVKGLVTLDNTTAGSINFIFGIGSALSIGTVNLDTPVGMIVFHIIQANTPFLLCLTEIKWVHGINNPADSMTKSKASNALKTGIDTNRINLDTIEWVERTAKTNERATDVVMKPGAANVEVELEAASVRVEGAASVGAEKVE